MSAKSPGVYITEKDMSSYTVVDGSTVVAIVGYASKGPIAVPTIIKSYQSFVSTFGTPTIVGYSSLAVRNIFAVGNSVIFYRVADEDLAASSKRIVKNATNEVLGYRTLIKNADVLVGDSGYFNQSIYRLSVDETNSGGVPKILYIRSPATGKLSIANIMSQMSAQMAETSGVHEILMPSTYARAGLYSFNIRIDADVGTPNFQIGTAESNSFVELYNYDKYETIVSKIKAASLGSNAITSFNLKKTSGSSTYPTVMDDIYGDSQPATAAICGFKINGTEISISVPPDSTFQSLLLLLNAKLADYNAFVLFKESTNSSSVPSELVFVSRSRGVGSFMVIDTPAVAQSLFGTGEGYVFVENTELEYIGISTKVTTSGVTALNVVNSVSGNFDILYDENTKSVKLLSKTTGINSKASIVGGTYGVSLLTTGSTGPNIGTQLTPVNGQRSLNLSSISRDLITKKIVFTSEVIEAPVIAAVSAANNYLDLTSIIGGIDTGINGAIAIPASAMDIIAISSIEKGSDCSKISIEKALIVNPLDVALNTINIYIYYDGVLKETFEDVSMSTTATNRFDLVINNTIENGGSAYVNFEFVKTEANDIINFPNGVYSLGNAMNDGDIAASEETNLSNYLSYDYAVGNNGILTTGGADLFTEALDPAGDLSNTDMYDFHVLITPDNIETSVQESAIILAAFRKDFIYVCDTPFGLSSVEARDWHNGKGYGRESPVDSSYASVYWPWVKLYDTVGKKYVWSPPSVVMAAKYVELDKLYGSWFAPAGELRGRLVVGDIEYSAKLSERDDIYTGMNRINPIIKFNDGRTVIFGEKTCLRENSALAKIHTRRMVLEIKKKVRAVLQSFLFMPNYAEVWGKASSSINAILEPYKRGGGISYYSTVIDQSTTTAEMQQQDIMVGVIHIIPVGIIEDIEISLNIDKVGEKVTVA